MKSRKLYSILVGLGMLVAGVVTMLILFQFDEPPAEAATAGLERQLTVQVALMHPEDHPVTIHGYGELRPARAVALAPEVSGVVTHVNKNLDVGRTVRVGELLFAISPDTYRTAHRQAKAEVEQQRTAIERTRVEWENEKARKGTLERTRTLAYSQFDRSRTLLMEGVGNQAEVDRAEQTYNSTLDLLDQLRAQLATYPIMIEEQENRLEASAAVLEQAEINLEKTRIVAPFDARIQQVLMSPKVTSVPKGMQSLGVGHYAEAGVPLLVLADDRILEIPVKLDARDARNWLRFKNDGSTEGMAWFGEVEPVACEVSWTDAEGETAWTGYLDRVEQYDPKTRTLTVAIRVSAADNLEASTFPLAAGMFCEVSIPGRTLKNVYAVPQSAISVDGNVFLSKSDRLKSTHVEVAHYEGATAYVSNGLAPNDLVITTRLVNPLENTLLAQTGQTE